MYWVYFLSLFLAQFHLVSLESVSWGWGKQVHHAESSVTRGRETRVRVINAFFSSISTCKDDERDMETWDMIEGWSKDCKERRRESERGKMKKYQQ